MAATNYEAAKERILDFLKSYYKEKEDGAKLFKYSNQISLIARREQVLLLIEQDDVNWYDPELSDWISENTIRYRNLFYDAIDECIKEILGDKEPPVIDALDAFSFQRLYMDRQQRLTKGDMAETREEIRKRYPPDLLRRYEVYFKARTQFTPMAVRELRARFVGKLVLLRGVVIRCTEVKPLASVITYICDTCGNEVFQPVNGLSYMPALNCPSRECVESKANGRLNPQMRGSKFTKFQEIRVQEMSDQVTVGSTPRSITVYLNGELTRTCIPGDVVQITGVLMPALMRSGGGAFRQMVGGLVTEVFLDAHHVQNNRSESEEFALGIFGGVGSDPNLIELTEDELTQISADDFYERLAKSIAPEIYGMLDIKKTLLLSLVGGVNKNASGMKIRGAVNVLLMGDPGVAKSQLLSFIDRVALRSQYTTGRGSSGVGLTAAVVRDPLTGELTLEGGSLVLADRGICCIDEFDKMMDSDRTAIHEVMEQQTISIAKAGLMTTLNARTSIIAAANPAYGRYNPNRSIEENIHLPAALLSRFDVIWLIQDVPDRDSDLLLAEHITKVHQNGPSPIGSHVVDNPEYSTTAAITDQEKQHQPKDSKKSQTGTTSKTASKPDSNSKKKGGAGLAAIEMDSPSLKETRRSRTRAANALSQQQHQQLSSFEPINLKLFRKYIALCKCKEPVMPDELKILLVEKYVDMRRHAKHSPPATALFTSPRLLLAAIRLCTALARIRLADVVNEADVKEALRLLDSATVSLQPCKQQKEISNINPVNRAFELIREMLQEAAAGTIEPDSTHSSPSKMTSTRKHRQRLHSIPLSKVYARCESRGLHPSVVDDCLYSHWKHILYVDSQTDTVHLV